MVIFFGTDTSPSSGVSSPTIMRNSVVLPEPLGPTRPTFSPGLSWKDASTKRICLPYCLLIFENEITRRSLYVEGEQHVPRARPERAVPGADVQHAAGDDGRGTVERSAVRLHVVDGVELAVRVERPHDRSIGRRERADRAVHRSGEHDAGDGRDRRRLRAVAPASLLAARERGGRREPRALAGREVDRMQPAGIRTVRVGDGKVRV